MKSNFFHAAVKGRASRNILLHLVEGSSSMTQDIHLLRQEAVEYYSSIYTQDTYWKVFTNIDPKKVISSDDSIWIGQEVLAEEIRDALFDIGGEKAPGLEAFNARFFQQIGMWWVLLLLARSCPSFRLGSSSDPSTTPSSLSFQKVTLPHSG